MPDAKSFGPSNKLPQYIAALAVCTGSLAAGAVLGWTSNISTDLENGKYNDIKMDTSDLGWIGSMATLGALVMCFPIGYICDKIGRKWAMLMLIIPFTVGWLLIIFATSIAMMFVGRFITGMAGGAFCISAPMYTSEIAEKEIRGALGSYFQLLLTVGILFSYVVAYLVEDLKLYTIICAIVPLVFGVVFFFQPETPVYLIKRGREQDAKNSLRRLRGSQYDVDGEYEEIKAMLEAESKITMKLTDSLKKRATKKAALIAFGLMLFQQLSGINAFIFYTSTIFESSNTGLDPKEQTIIVGVMQVAATFASSLVIDKLGRKILLIISDVLMAVCAIILGAYFSVIEIDGVDSDSIGWIPVVALCMFMIVFSLGYGPIPWMISSEVFPPEIKSTASSAAGTFNWLLAFLVTKYYNDLNAAIGGDVFYIFGGISILGTVFVLLIVPETKGKSLDQIQRELSGEPTSKGIDNEGYN